MLSLMKRWRLPASNPIGIDFGADVVRLAQVEFEGAENEGRLVAAASAPIPTAVREDPAARPAFLIQTLRDLLNQGKFHGRRAILGLPASCMYVEHMRLPHVEDEEMLRDALPREARGRLPLDPSQALLRHIVAGQVNDDGEVRDEVILMAARRDQVDQLLHAAGKARLDVVALNIQPRAIVDCFNHVYRRRGDSEKTNCFVDVGCCSTRVVIARAEHIFFVRILPIGSDHFSRAVADVLGMSLDAARALRIKRQLAAPDEPVDAERDKRIEQACEAPLIEMTNFIRCCRADHEASFPNCTVDRLIFVGGEACDKTLPQAIGRELEIAAQVGDPLVRMRRLSNVGVESGIDRRCPQPAWTVAVGLSMGPLQKAETLAMAS